MSTRHLLRTGLSLVAQVAPRSARLTPVGALCLATALYALARRRRRRS